MFSDKKPTNSTAFSCQYIDQCSGCQIATLDESSQIDFKKNHFTDLWKKYFDETPSLDFFRPTESEFRDRIDITIERDNLSQNFEENNIENQKIGFYKKDSRDILDIAKCPLLSIAAQKLFSEIRKINFPIKKGSARIRVSPYSSHLTSSKNAGYLAGAWLDFSNEDIKKLLDEANHNLNSSNVSTLHHLLQVFDVVEIGQKRKKLSIINNQYKLLDSEMNPWFETYDQNLNAVPLKMNVGSFSQTGFTTNKILISKVLNQLKETSPHLSSVGNEKKKAWLELCSGSGNLTIPLLSTVDRVIATELDENAVNALMSTAIDMNLSDRLHVERVNIHKPSEKMKSLLSGVDGVLADPPRSGLQGFLEVLESIPKENLPKNFIYVSCFAESLISDLEKLYKLGYMAQKVIGVDQFPHSTHCEWIVRLKR